MLTEKDYCDYDTCVALKELGYNRGAYAYYFPNHTEDLIFNTHNMRGCSINEMVRGYNTYSKDTVGHELIDAPTMWEAQKWLREERGVNIFVMQIVIEGSGMHRYASYIQLGDKIWTCRYYSLYEEALLEGIKETVKILKEYEADKVL